MAQRVGRIYRHKARKAADRWIELPQFDGWSARIELLFIPDGDDWVARKGIGLVKWSLESISNELVEVYSWTE